MNKRRRLLFMIIGGGLVFVAGIAIFLARFAGQLAAVEQNDAAIFADNALSEISVRWDPMMLEYYASAELLTDGKDEERKVKMAKLQGDLGKYKSGDGVVRNLRAVKDDGGDDALVGDYSVDAQFEKGKATVEMKLMKRKIGDWQIMTFQVLQPK